MHGLPSVLRSFRFGPTPGKRRPIIRWRTTRTAQAPWPAHQCATRHGGAGLPDDSPLPTTTASNESREPQVEAADAGQRDDVANLAPLDRSPGRRVAVERQMGPVVVAQADVVAVDRDETALTQDEIRAKQRDLRTGRAPSTPAAVERKQLAATKPTMRAR